MLVRKGLQSRDMQPFSDKDKIEIIKSWSMEDHGMTNRLAWR